MTPSELDKIVRRLRAGPYQGYPDAKDRLFIKHIKVLPSTRQLLVPDGPWCVRNHPNRLNVPGRLLEPETPLRGQQSAGTTRARLGRHDAWTDQYGRPVHPYWRQLLSDPRIGLPTGHGYFYKYGPNTTVDSAIYRFYKKDQPPEFLLVKRKDTGAWALPGGFVDSTDLSLEAAARREVLEETGLGDIGGTGKVILFERTVGLRTTLHAWTENALLLFHCPGQYLMGTTPVAGDDAVEAGWFTEAAAKQKLTLLDHHVRYLSRAASVLASH